MEWNTSNYREKMAMSLFYNMSNTHAKLQSLADFYLNRIEIACTHLMLVFWKNHLN